MAGFYILSSKLITVVMAEIQKIETVVLLYIQTIQWILWNDFATAKWVRRLEKLCTQRVTKLNSAGRRKAMHPDRYRNEQCR